MVDDENIEESVVEFMSLSKDEYVVFSFNNEVSVVSSSGTETGKVSLIDCVVDDDDCD